jgi:hypothetical protein
MHKLEQMIHISKSLDKQLEDKANELDSTEPAKAKAIRESALFYTRQRTTDLLTQMAVTVQGYLALDLVKKNNVELVKGVDRASTTTVAALRTAVTVAQALTNQRLVLEQIGALNTTTAGMIDTTGEMLKSQTGAIHEQAASSTIPLETLQRAFQNIYDTMDQIDALQARGARQHEADGHHALQRGREVAGYIARAEGVEKGRLENASSPFTAIESKMSEVNVKVERALARFDRVTRALDERDGARAKLPRRERQRLNSDLGRRLARVGVAVGVISILTIVVGLIMPIGMFGFLAAIGLAIGIAAMLAFMPGQPAAKAPSADLPNGRWCSASIPIFTARVAALPAPARAEIDAISARLPRSQADAGAGRYARSEGAGCAAADVASPSRADRPLSRTFHRNSGDSPTAKG